MKSLLPLKVVSGIFLLSLGTFDYAAAQLSGSQSIIKHTTIPGTVAIKIIDSGMVKLTDFTSSASFNSARRLCPTNWKVYVTLTPYKFQAQTSEFRACVKDVSVDSSNQGYIVYYQTSPNTPNIGQFTNSISALYTVYCYPPNYTPTVIGYAPAELSWNQQYDSQCNMDSSVSPPARLIATGTATGSTFDLPGKSCVDPVYGEAANKRWQTSCLVTPQDVSANITDVKSSLNINSSATACTCAIYTDSTTGIPGLRCNYTTVGNTSGGTSVGTVSVNSVSYTVSCVPAS
jgi:hypothetical protein